MDTKLLARGAILTALGEVLLYLAGLFPGGSLALTALAGLLPAALVISGGLKWGCLTWLATGALGLILLPNKAVALLYALVFGPYTLWKSRIERLGRLLPEWVLKLAVFNGVLAVFRLAFSGYFAQVTEVLPVSGWILWAVLNLVFAVYDIGCTRLIAAWLRRLGKAGA